LSSDARRFSHGPRPEPAAKARRQQHLASNPSGERQLQPFLDRVQKQLPPKFPRDAKGTTEAVFAVLSQELDRGMIVKVITELPEPLRVLWPHDLRAGA
jgi:uncharacterized protein (DUF2267 family)